jgi:class 3 adenylate cyclase
MSRISQIRTSMSDAALRDDEIFQEGEVQRGRIVQNITLIAFLVTVLYALIYAVMGWWWLTGYSALFLLWYAATYATGARGRTRLAGVVLIGGGLAQIGGISVLFMSPLGGTQVFLALLPVFALIAIYPGDRVWTTLYGVVSIALLVYLEVNRDTFVPFVDVQMQDAMLGPMRGLSIAITVVMIVAVFVSFFMDLHRARLAFREAHDQSESLLLNILPPSIAERLKNNETTIADDYDDASVLFADLVGFTRLAATQTASETVAMLNSVVSAFDEAVVAHGLEKIKTIGDAYMLAAGVPISRPDHATQMIRVALAMQSLLAAHNAQTGQELGLRIGIGSGPVTAGVIGSSKFIYDLWGDTVNVASRMESMGIPGRIQVTESVAKAAAEHFTFDDRGLIAVKGKGQMHTFLVAEPTP